jgi:hypothetical protein
MNESLVELAVGSQQDLPRWNLLRRLSLENHSGIVSAAVWVQLHDAVDASIAESIRDKWLGWAAYKIMTVDIVS